MQRHISYGKESDSSHSLALNLPASLVRHHGFDEQTALEETARRHNAEVANYLVTEEYVAREASPEVIRFLEAMRIMQPRFLRLGFDHNSVRRPPLLRQLPSPG